MDGELILVLWTALVFIGAIIGVIGVRMIMKRNGGSKESGNADTNNSNGKMITGILLAVIGAIIVVVAGGLLLYVLLY